MSNLATNLKDTAGQYLGRPAVRLGEVVLTYADLDELSARVAGGLLAHGLRPGDRVGILLPNVLAFPVLYYGALRIGAAVVAMDPRLDARAVRRCLDERGAQLVFAADGAACRVAPGAPDAGVMWLNVGPDFLDQVALWPQHSTVVYREDDDEAVVLCTADGTRAPTDIELTHGRMREAAFVAATALLDLVPDDIVMGCLPLFCPLGHSCGLNATVLAGACLSLLPRFDAATALRAIGRERATLFEGVPAMYGAMVQAGPRIPDTSGLRLSVCGGTLLPAEVRHAFADAFGTSVLEGPEPSETSCPCTPRHPDGAEAARRPAGAALCQDASTGRTAIVGRSRPVGGGLGGSPPHAARRGGAGRQCPDATTGRRP